MKKLILFLSVIWTVSAFGQATIGFHRVNQLLQRGTSGTYAQIVPRGTVQVTSTATGLLATIYRDPLLTSQITSGSVTSDANGNYDYYIPLNYCVDEAVSSPGQGSYTTKNICVNGGGTGVVGSGAAGQIPYYAANGTTVSPTSALPNGITATTQTTGDNTTKVATDAFANAAASTAATNQFSSPPVLGSTTPNVVNGTNGNFSGTVAANNYAGGVQPQNYYALNATLSKIGQMFTYSGSAPSQLTIVTAGDSTADFHNIFVRCALSIKFGLAGFDFGGAMTGSADNYGQPCASGGQTENSHTGAVTTESGDFARSPSGQIYNIASGASITFGSGGSSAYGNLLKVYWLCEPTTSTGAPGTITIQSYNSVAGTVTEFTGSAYCSTPTGEVFVVNKTTPASYTLTILASSGAVDIYGIGAIDTTHSGIVVATTAMGGISLPDSVSTPSTIINPWYASVAPDLVLFEMKNNGVSDSSCNQATTAAPTALQPYSYWWSQFASEWRAANVLDDLEFTASYPVGTANDPYGCIAMHNQAVQQWMQANASWYTGQGGTLYIDNYYGATNATMQAYDWIDTSVHATPLGQLAQSQDVWRQFGAGQWWAGDRGEDTANSNVQTNNLWLGSSDPRTNLFGLCTPGPCLTGGYASLHAYDNSSSQMFIDLSNQLSFWNAGHTTPVFCINTLTSGVFPTGCSFEINPTLFALIGISPTISSATSGAGATIQSTLATNGGTASLNLKAGATNSNSNINFYMAATQYWSAGNNSNTAWSLKDSVSGNTVVSIPSNTAPANALTFTAAGPALGGTGPTAPTQASTDSSTKIATTAFVAAQLPLTGTTSSIGGSALAVGACTSGTVSITGATTSMAVVATPATYPGDDMEWKPYVSSAGVVTVKVCADVAGTPTASMYNVRVIQ